MSTQPIGLSDVVIEEIDIRALSDEQIVELNDFANAMQAEVLPDDPPRPPDVAVASYRNMPTFVDFRTVVVREAGGRLIAEGQAVWWTTDENRHLVHASITVLPAFRRNGIGTTLLRRIVETAERQGRTVIIGGTNERAPAGAAFAARIGADAALAEHTNRLLLADVDRDMVRRWIVDGPGRAPGYSLVVTDGPHPDDLVEQVVDLNDVMNTAPRGDLHMEDWKLTVEQLRESEKRMAARGDERWFLAARDDATGELVGFTELFLNRKTNPETAYQGGTAVRPDHRGHALGKWLKAVNIDRLLVEHPEIVDVRTGNADSNEAMLGINNSLGFKPFIGSTAWQVSVERAKEHLAKEYVDGRA